MAHAPGLDAPAREALPELASVYWRPLVDEQSLRRSGRLWTLSTVAHTIPFLAVGALLLYLQPLSFAVAIVAIAHAWIIPELYAQRGANVVRPRRPAHHGPRAAAERAQETALGLLGDLVGHDARALVAETGLVLEPGRLGMWLVGPAGALLVRPGGRRVHCYCVKVNDRALGDDAAPTVLPPADRIAHLLLALRADEQGFATVANLAFSGAAWRVRRRLARPVRPALAAAVRAARSAG